MSNGGETGAVSADGGGGPGVYDGCREGREVGSVLMLYPGIQLP